MSPRDEDDVPVRFVWDRIREVQEAVGDVGRKIDATLGEYAVRLARLELRQDLTDRRLENDTSGRRYWLTTILAGLGLLVSVAALAAVLLKS